MVTGLLEYDAVLEFPTELLTTNVMLYGVAHVRPTESA